MEVSQMKRMPNKTPIEWTDYSSNPIFAYDRQTNKRGWHCVHVSEGCRNCYAEAINKRFGTGLEYSAQNANKIEFRLSEKECAALRKLNAKHPGAKVFLGDMLDIFQHGPTGISDQMLDALFDVLESCDDLIFQLLTKHPARARGYLNFRYKDKPAPKHVWLGTSVEDQKTANQRIPHLRQAPVALRFVSYEPALCAVDFYDALPCPCPCDNDGEKNFIDWLIIGGESGKGARSFDLRWARGAIMECRAAGVAVFVKQLGSRPVYRVDSEMGRQLSAIEMQLRHSKGGDMSEWPEDLRVREFPKAESLVTARESLDV